MDYETLCDDLAAEQEALDEIVARIDARQWLIETPPPDWTVRDQIAHLAYSDDVAAHAARDPDGFRRDLALPLPSDPGPRTSTPRRPGTPTPR